MKKLLLAAVLASSFVAQSAMATCKDLSPADRFSTQEKAPVNTHYAGKQDSKPSEQQRDRAVRSQSNQGAT